MHISRAELYHFVQESNRIEGITREPTQREVEATWEFLEAPVLTIVRVKALVAEYQPNARLRDKPGMDVHVGDFYPPPGGHRIEPGLQHCLDNANTAFTTPYRTHHDYERLHPFTDGNGRSGRAIWLWMMRGHAPLGFLHTWYYQSLQEGR